MEKYSHILRLRRQPGVFNVQHSFQKILLGFAKIYIYGFNEDYSDTSLTLPRYLLFWNHFSSISPNPILRLKHWSLRKRESSIPIATLNLSHYIYIWESDLNILAYVNLQCVWVAIETTMLNFLLSFLKSSHIKPASSDCYWIAGRIRAIALGNIMFQDDCTHLTDSYDCDMCI